MSTIEASSEDVCFDPASNASSQPGIDAIFRRQAARCATAIAVVYGAQELSYAELDRRASRLAGYLKQRGVRPEEPIGILLAPGLEQVVCQVAVIRAGGTSVPLDPDAPRERLRFMLEDVGARIVLTSAAGQSHLSVPEPVLVEESEAWPSYPVAEDMLSHTARAPDHRTHVLFTSGTTGRPKAVEILARGIIRLTVNTRYVSLASNDRIAAIANPTFDASLFEIWGALLNGATAVLLPKQTCIDPHALRHSLQVQRITVMFITTTLFNQTVYAYPDAFRGVRQLLVGGEALNPRAVRAMLEVAPPRRLLNAYGPTEGTTFSLYHEITLEELDAGAESIPIGKPIDRTQVFVLDSERRPVQTGEIGEIYIGGDGLARGYWNRPELTGERFVEVDGLVEAKACRLYRTGDLGSLRMDGVLNFHGRNDNQVKIRGHRIEIEEIEAVLLASGLLREAVVTVQQTELGDRYLVAFVVPYGEAGSSDSSRSQDSLSDRLADHLSSRLPAYMRPRLSCVKTLPMNANGKVDRRALGQQDGKPQPPVNGERSGSGTREDKLEADDTETLLRAIWCRTLNVEAVDANDNFFELGGDSLQAASLIVQLSKHFCYPLPVQALYDNPTLSRLAAYLGNHTRMNGGFNVVDEMATLVADAELPDDIHPLAAKPGPWCVPGKGRVFLTGATGFLAAFLLRDLLRLPEVKEVACLVRAATDEGALVRIRSNMMQYGTWEDAFSSRLKPLAGDLAQPHFGLGQSRFEALAGAADVVFHLGAHVNYIEPYSAHKAANVTGTINVIRFATTTNVKPLHYVSTIAAFGPAGLLESTAVVYEDDDMAGYLNGLKFDSGYSQSQWVTEQLVWEAVRRGVPAAVYRPGFIMGDSQTGTGNPNDFVGRLVKGCIALGAYPALARQGKQFVPVDYVSAALLRIAGDNANLKRAYHLVPPGTVAQVDLIAFFKLLGECGYPLEELTYQQWARRLTDDPRLQESPLMPLLPMLAEPVYGQLTRWEVYEGMPVYDSSNTRQALEKAGGIAYSNLDHPLLQRYLDYWVAIGFLGKAKGSR
ncbi:amino acid adenylation domain-containing protein [Paraburkholderia susongensis]|uniref:Amino acid adenylation domain-containing protein/thioester reductase domain-containing protein n=1 Tax=Paraburkholderia susongensis TaxID=1515439 RepID=A0A1X7L9H2_9BURK|nr:amino acid adenylation domain-containing protein [Paraburkholderia susongensis]SMG50134.1 amino acid adenylation domain-containing protein/thioester reductase domain-containing protein [Paraburkholderia susongensis]